MTIYTFNKSIFIKSEVPIVSGTIELMDQSGKKIFNYRLENISYKKIPVSTDSGKYILKLVSQDKTIIRQIEL